LTSIVLESVICDYFAKSTHYQITTIAGRAKMRKKIIAQRSIFDQSIDQLKTLIRPERILKQMDAVIDQNDGIVARIHKELTDNVSNTGCRGMSAEQILRVALVRHLKQYSWRELAERLNDGICLRWFTRFYSAPIPHFTTLQKAVRAIDADLWSMINDDLIEFAKMQKLEKGRLARADTTVVETNIAYPTDARLLWDGVRVLTRTMERIRRQMPLFDFGFADRRRCCKKLCYKITMVKGPKADKTRLKLYRRLIRVANEVFEMGCNCLGWAPDSDNLVVMALLEKLDDFLTLSAVAIDQCERRVIKNEKVPASEKIVSVFEHHTDIIRRGKTSCPTEFGHKVNFVTGKSGLITQYQVLRGNPGDNELMDTILEKHQQQYGKAPAKLSADRRYFSAANESKAYEAGVKHVSICKPGYRSEQRRQIEKEGWFKKLQKFRAGIEGIISGLMRGLGLKRCIWKGWQAFKRYVGLSVVTFNLRKIAMLI
jgi:transposase, IS5 family